MRELLNIDFSQIFFSFLFLRSLDNFYDLYFVVYLMFIQIVVLNEKEIYPFVSCYLDDVRIRGTLCCCYCFVSPGSLFLFTMTTVCQPLIIKRTRRESKEYEDPMSAHRESHTRGGPNCRHTCTVIFFRLIYLRT